MGRAVELLPVREVVEEAGKGFEETPKYRYELVVRGRIERSLVEEISRAKGEPGWMRRLRLRAHHTRLSDEQLVYLASRGLEPSEVEVLTASGVLENSLRSLDTLRVDAAGHLRHLLMLLRGIHG